PVEGSKLRSHTLVLQLLQRVRHLHHLLSQVLGSLREYLTLCFVHMLLDVVPQLVKSGRKHIVVVEVPEFRHQVVEQLMVLTRSPSQPLIFLPRARIYVKRPTSPPGERAALSFEFTFWVASSVPGRERTINAATPLRGLRHCKIGWVQYSHRHG